MKIAVTGYAGYIGQVVISELVKHPNIELVLIDSRDGKAIEHCRGVHADVLIHLAAYTSVVESFQHPDDYYQNNCSNYHSFLNLQGNSFGRIIYASSFSVYDVHLEISPSSVYGSTKLEGEFITKRYTDNNLILRFANPVGISTLLHGNMKDRKLNYPNALVKLAQAKINGDTFLIHNLPEMVRDYYPVDWIARTISACLHDTTGTHDLGSGQSTLSVALLKSICEQYNVPYAMVDAPPGTALGTQIPIERLRLVESIIPEFAEYCPTSYCANQLQHYIDVFK